MKRIFSSYKTLMVLVVILSCPNSVVLAGPAESILIKENEQTFEISVPVSNLVLVLPKANFNSALPPQREGSMASPRFFQFADNTTGVGLSGWFEHARGFDGVKEPKPASVQGTRLIYENIVFGKVGDWDSVSYDVVFQSNRIPNIKAHLVRENTWIELHISGTQHELIRDIIKSIQVQVKP